MKELVEFMEEAVREGLTSREINSQVDLLLDEVARGKLEKSPEGSPEWKVETLQEYRSSAEITPQIAT